MDWLKNAILELRSDKDDVVVKSGDKIIRANVASGRFQYYTHSAPEFIVSSRIVECTKCEDDDLCKELARLAYCNRFIKEKITMEGSIFTPADVFHPDNKSYWLFNIGDLVSEFNALVYRYQSEEMPKNWLYSRVARLKAVGLYAYIVDGFGSRRHPRSVIRVKIIKQVNIRRFERVVIQPTIEVTEEKAEISKVDVDAEMSREGEVEARIKSLIETL